MSKLFAALIGAGVAVGVAYVIWRVHQERERAKKDEAAKRDSDAAQASEAEAPQGVPSTSAEAPAPSTPPAASPPPASSAASTPMPSTKPAPSTAPAPPASKETAPSVPLPTSSDVLASSAASIALVASAAASDSSTPTLDVVKQLATASNPGPQTAKQSLSRLFEHARRIIPDLTLAEFTAARTIASAPDRAAHTAQIATTERHRAPADLARATEHIARPDARACQPSRAPEAITNAHAPLVHAEAGG